MAGNCSRGDLHVRISTVLFISMSLFGSSNVNAGYDDTDWGMTLPQVRKLHPGGKVGAATASGKRKSPSDATTYETEKDVAGYRASVIFYFLPKKGLSEVWVMFKRPRKSDRQGFSELNMERRYADPIMQTLREALDAKYGSPFSVTPCKNPAESRESEGEDRRQFKTDSCGARWLPCWTKGPGCRWIEIELEDLVTLAPPEASVVYEENHSVSVLYRGKPPVSTKGL